jgi:twitching motility protein PilT
MKPIDWLLGHLDEPGVSEIVLGIGRPAAVRVTEGFRPITSMNFDRNDIETLVAGTPMSGLIGSPASLPPTEMQIDARRIVVEVVRQGYNAAIRISKVGGQDASNAPPRTKTTSAQPQSAPPPVDVPVVRMTSSTAAPRTPTTTAPPRSVTPMAPAPAPAPAPARQPLPPDDAPLVSVRMTSSTTAPRTTAATAPPRTMTIAPRTMAPTPQPRATGTSTPPLTVTPISTTTMPRITAEPSPPFEPLPIVDVPTEAPVIDPPVTEPNLEDNLDHSFASVLGGGGEIVEHQEDPLPGFPEGEAPLPAPEWYGPQIVDEYTDITALHALLEAAYRRTASDLHIIAGQPVTIRRLGELSPLDAKSLIEPFDRAVYSALFGPLDATMAERFLLPLLGPYAQQRLAEVGYVDLGFQVPGRGRVRANISQQQDGLAGCFRLCRDRIPTLAGLGLPQELEKTVRHHQGLVVIAGPSGHGKTTTMAALVDQLNTSNSDHIITIEDPVEIEHPAKKAIVSHREVGRHTLSFVTALKASLREDPDVIVIGELRDRETVEIALAAAETGHLVLSTISTPSAVKTIDRLIDMFPPDDQVQVRASISGTLRAVIAQRLLPNATRDGQVAAIEMVTGVLPLATMIRENKLFQLPSLMQRGRAFGMIRLDDSLAEHVRAKRITEEVALNAAENKKELAGLIAGTGRTTPNPTSSRGLFGGKGTP